MEGQVCLRVLGPVEVRVGDGWRRPTGPQVRLLLAFSALWAGQVIPAADLVDAMWGERPPPSARASLQVLIVRMRKSVAEVPGCSVERYGDGYRLQIDPGLVDLHRFRSLARLAQRAGGAEEAAAMLAEALMLWRGPALADVPATARAEAIRSGLDEEHLSAVQDRFGFLLAAGRDADVASEIPLMLARYPLVERLAEMLMIARYRGGRPADALQVFRDLRSRLADELGIEPCSELQRLHQQILQRDVADGPRHVGSDNGGSRRGLDRVIETGARPRQNDLISDVVPVLPSASEKAGPTAGPEASSEAMPRNPSQNGRSAPALEPGTGHPPVSQGQAPKQDDQPVPLAVPRQLPAAVAHFAGRTAELAVLERAAGDGFGPAAVISAIGGMAGVGKTALALRWAHRAAEKFPDGQLYANMHGYDVSGEPANAGEVIGRFLCALGVAPEGIPADLDARAALYRSVLAGKRVLIVADNATDAEQVRPLLPGAPGSLLLVTSRSSLAGLGALDDACTLNLNVPTAAEAAELLSVRLGSDRFAAEPETAAELVRLCGRLPLAVAIVAARAAASNWRLAALATELADETRRLGALRLGETGADIQAVFSWSYRRLSPAAARMFRLLNIHPGPDISVRVAASLAGQPMPEASAALHELADASLVTERALGRFALHDLLRAYAAEQGRAYDMPEECHAAACRMLDHYLQTASSAAQLLDLTGDILAHRPPPPGVTPEIFTDRGRALDWFGAEHKALLAIIRVAADPVFDDYAQHLPWVLTSFFEQVGHWYDLADAQRIALACAERLDDLASQARAHRALSYACINLRQDRLARAHLVRSIELAQRLDDRVAEARAFLTLSVAHERENQPAESLSSSRKALVLAEASGDILLQAKASNNMGYAYAMLGDPNKGLAYCQRSLDLYRRVAKPSLEANTWDSLGYIYQQLGDYQQSAISYQRAVCLFREYGASYSSAQSLIRLGDTYNSAGDTQEAKGSWRQALAILEDLACADASQVRCKLDDLAITASAEHNEADRGGGNAPESRLSASAG